ncbi:MFS transporter [Brevundimonas aurantiaca]|uniref:MFS transporter n=1 Tax=Brevundimonas aurantiaca TaxID=74316 RepID=UPI001CD64AEF|nr:MFS transporter [Brevundimonas aurantiaca]
MLVALAVSTVGDEITLITLMFRTAGEQAAFAVPALLIAQLVPGLIAVPYIGRLIDHRDAGRLLIFASVAQGLVVAAMAFQPDMVATVIGATLLGLLFAVSGTATFALIPVVAQGLGVTLARANGGLEFIRSAGMLAGPAAGGLLVAWGGTGKALLIDAASFVMLAAIIWLSGLRRMVAATADQDGKPPSLLADYRPLLRNRRITVMTGALTLGVFATAIADVAFVFLVTVALRAGPAALGALTACWAAGMLVGAVAAGETAQRRPSAVAFSTAILMGVTMLVIGAMPYFGAESLVGVGLAFAIGGAANSAHNVAVRTLLQMETPAGAHGRVAAIYVTATRSATITGFLVGGLFVPASSYDAYLLAGLLGVVAGIAGWWLFSASSAKSNMSSR